MSAAAPAPLLPPPALAAYLLCVAGAGFLANVAVVVALFRRRRNVFHWIVMQLALADALQLSVAAGLETWSRNEGTWRFGGAACVAFLGCETFASAASAYFAVTLALHALATAAQERSATARRRCDDDDELRSSRSSLVAAAAAGSGSDSSTPPRTMRVDYRLASAAAVPVAVPLAFVWSLAASLSVPAFLLARTARAPGGGTLCTFAEPGHCAHAQALLAAFGLAAPAVLLTAAGVAAATVRWRARRPAAAGRGDDADAALALAACLAAVYAVLVAPRSTLAAYHAYVTPDEVSAPPPAGLALALSCLCYAAALVRPLLSVMLFPDLRRSFSFKVGPRVV